MSSLGVFYTCYREGAAVEKSIDTHFEHIPNCKIFLVSEGDDYSHLERKHEKIKTSIKSDIGSWPHKNIPQSQSVNLRDPVLQLGLERYFDEFLSRVQEAIDYCKSDYLLISQPDVILRGSLTIPEGVSLLQPFVNSYRALDSENDINKALQEIPGSCEFAHWGFPQILSTECFRKSIELLYESDKKILRKMMSSDFRFHHSDIFLPAFFAAAGYESTHNTEVIECLREPGWRNTSHPLVHQYKELYPNPQSAAFSH